MSDHAYLDDEDVTVEPIAAPLCDCGERATHAVRLDMRMNGMSSVVLEACAECAQSNAVALRKSLKR